jgi:hypothetical protein
MPSKEEYLAAADLADRAAVRLEKGWCQKTLAKNASGSDTGEKADDACQWCLVGSIYAEGVDVKDPFIGTVWNTAAERLDMKASEVAHWNDHPDRTQAEVVRAMRDTANELRKKAEAYVAEACEGR